jgi:hypothetical protein
MSILDVLNDDLSNINQVLSAYGDLFTEAKADISINNKTLQQANMEQPSNYARFDQIRVELEIIMELADLKVSQVRAQAMRQIIKDDSKHYGERMLDKMIDENPSYLKYYKIYLRCKEMYTKSKSIVESMSQRGYSLNNITKIKVAALEDTVLYD